MAKGRDHHQGGGGSELSTTTPTGFSGWLQRVRRSGEHSDVIVEVDGQEMHLHLLPLLNASSYFRALAADPNWSSRSTSPSSQSGEVVDERRVVSLTGLPGGAEGLAGAVDYCYLVKAKYSVGNVARIRAAAEYLGMADVMDSTKKYLYTNVFAHWRASVAYLEHDHARLGAPVDEYIETRCLKVVVAALARAFCETKYLSAPIVESTPGRGGGVGGDYRERENSTIPCEALAEMLARVASLRDSYASEALDALVEADVNLSVQCRQGRNVRGWLASVVQGECVSSDHQYRARCLVVLCLARMAARSAPECRPRLELSSQYWCSLLEHVERLVNIPVADHAADRLDMQMRLVDMKRILERRIGASLDELDEDLYGYELEPDTLLAMVRHYLEKGDPSLDEQSESVAEIVGEVDKFLWRYAEVGSINLDTFTSLCTALPRHSHDSIFRSIEKLLATRSDIVLTDKQGLWRLVDPARLSPAVHETALNNPEFLSQPHVLETVLQQHREVLAKAPDVGDSASSMRPIMQKVINASLKLLEENSRRSREMAELQHQYSSLQLLGSGKLLRSSESSPASTPCWGPSLTVTHTSSPLMHEALTETGTEGSELDSETPSMATVSSIADQPRLDLRDIYSLETYKKPHLKEIEYEAYRAEP